MDWHAVEASRTEQLQQLIERLNLGEPLSNLGLALVDQALTHVSSGRQHHHERLEFLGDAVLRLTATEFIDSHHGDLSVGASSTLRAQLVSDRWLADLGEQLAIDPLLVLGPKALGDQAARRTIRADVTEALIGAVYSSCGSVAPIHRWLTPYWIKTADAVLAAPHRFNGKTALQEWSQGQGLGLPSYSTEERNRRHGDPRRFQSLLTVGDHLSAEGWGPSRKEAEQAAARAALDQLEPDG